jgi:hypothetical protein
VNLGGLLFLGARGVFRVDIGGLSVGPCPARSVRLTRER